MIELKKLTIKNFMSIGAITQTIEFSNDNLVLVLGENLDLGGNDNRNGCGKSSIVNALSYALYGSALTNIKLENLINKSNMKNMFVTLTFDVNGIGYKIERGRKPNIFKFTKDGQLSDSSEQLSTDESQGEGRHTQEEIERTIGISHDMFKHILALNTYVEPFLALKSNEQRNIIEELLGITKLSEKAEKLRNEIKTVRDKIKEEEFRINASHEANKRIEQNISNLEIKSNHWNTERDRRINQLNSSIMQLMNVNIDSEIALHKTKKDIESLNLEYRNLTKELNSVDKDLKESQLNNIKLERIISSSKEKICPTCNQEMDKDTHHKVHHEYMQQKEDINNKIIEKSNKKDALQNLINSVSSSIPQIPNTFYSTIDEAYCHKTSLDTLGNSLEKELEYINPYLEQIELLKKDGLQEINFESMNSLVKLRDHQEFLLKLLTNKDSFIRKKIIDQNLTYLNHRLAHYQDKIGLPHTVKFKSDLEVEITLLGKEYDFDNLSRGERTRLILSLSWSFRDVFESLNEKINLLFIDELVDNGIDSAGADNILKILKEMSRTTSKNVYLISHKEEFISRVENILTVVKENGFTTIGAIINEDTDEEKLEEIEQ